MTTIELVSRFAVDDEALSALHTRAFGGDGEVQPWSRRLERHARTAGCEWLHVDYEPHLAHFYLNKCGFRPARAGLMRLE